MKVQKLKEPNEDSWCYYLGVVYERAGKTKKAIELYKESFGKAPTHVAAKRIAACYDNMGIYDKAIEYYDKAYEIDSTQTTYLYMKANTEDDAGMTKEALVDIDRYITLEPDDYSGYYRRGWIKDHTGDIEGALEDYNTAIVLEPDEAYTYLNRGVLYRLMGEQDKAKADFEQVVKLDSIPENAKCAPYAYYYLGNKEKAINVLNIILKTDSKGNYYDAACLYSIMGNTDKSVAYLRKAFEKGFRRLTHTKRDRDLNNIRNTQGYKDLMQEYEKKHQQESQDYKEKDNGPYEDKIEEIPFTKEGGVYKVKCTINDLPLHFIFDTGASDVPISSVEATFMVKNDYLSTNDVIGKQNYINANGEICEGTVINLHDVKLGDLHLNNVKASVVKNQSAPLLLGQTVLSRLGKIEIDNSKRVLRITYKKKYNKHRNHEPKTSLHGLDRCTGARKPKEVWCQRIDTA